MIRLEDVSTNKFIIDNKNTSDIVIWYARRLLLDYNITDYQKLEDFLESELANEISKDDYYYNKGIRFLRSELAFIKRKIKSINEKEKKIEIFDFNSPIALEINDKTLDMIDGKNKGKILLCSSPIILGSGINSIRKLSIRQIKDLIGHVDSTNFKSCLLNLEGITAKKLEDIDRAIWFYEEQIVRQYFETKESDTNLFFLNSQVKRQIVEEQIKDIAEYFASNANECVWGKLTASEKKKMLKFALTNNKDDMVKIRGSFVNAISRYTTLGELETGILNDQEVVTIIGGKVVRERKKPIDRFVTQKR